MNDDYDDYDGHDQPVVPPRPPPVDIAKLCTVQVPATIHQRLRIDAAVYDMTLKAFTAELLQFALDAYAVARRTGSNTTA